MERLRLVVLIDGLNQRLKMDWGRILERFSAELELIGGQLIITARTPGLPERPCQAASHYLGSQRDRNLRNGPSHERDKILADCGVVAANLHLKVAASLRNPRLLGIALELLKRYRYHLPGRTQC